MLGQGGGGEVHLCRDRAIGRDVARKTMLVPKGASASHRHFLREARVQAQLEHPSIVPVYDLGAAPDGRPFFTMRRVRGQTLEQVLLGLARDEPPARAGWSRRRLLEAFARVCLAVDYAHRRGVLHRDLKPTNIMLGDFGEVYVLDWGVAMLVADPTTVEPVIVPGEDPRSQAALVGTPGYMSPEQILGESQDARADVYALGAILFEILTLRGLREGGTLESIAVSSAEPLPAFGPDVPPEPGALCAHALAFDRGARAARARGCWPRRSSVTWTVSDGSRRPPAPCPVGSRKTWPARRSSSRRSRARRASWARSSPSRRSCRPSRSTSWCSAARAAGAGRRSRWARWRWRPPSSWSLLRR